MSVYCTSCGSEIVEAGHYIEKSWPEANKYQKITYFSCPNRRWYRSGHDMSRTITDLGYRFDPQSGERNLLIP